MGRATGTGKTSQTGLDALRALMDMGAGALRGATTTMLGTPGDIAELATEGSFAPTPAAQALQAYVRPAAKALRGLLPTSERVSELLPAGPQTPYEALGRFAPLTPSMIGKMARPMARMAGEGLNTAMLSGEGPLASLFPAAMPRTVVKPRGGNWLEGMVERSLSPLKAGLEEQTVLQNPGLLDPEYIKGQAHNIALNKWIAGPLTKYVKRDMATPDDPIRALAEQGILHYDPRAGGLNPELSFFLQKRRDIAGYPVGMAKSPLADDWEIMADTSLASDPFGDVKDLFKNKENWMRDLDPNTPIYKTWYSGETGFKHLTDELRNALNPESGLPRSLLLNVDDMKQMGIDRAVRHVAKINAYRAENMEKAALASMEGMPVVKDYPEAGMKWMELKHPESAEETKKWLKQEGDIMGHCVGGYCDDVMSGRSRIFSLRDAKGMPHVTIESAPGYKESYMAAPEDLQTKWRLEADQYASEAEDEDEYMELLQDYLDKRVDEWNTKNTNIYHITQIKGKQNLAPKPEYLPFVQDFVKSQGPWSDVGDLQNTGLRRARDVFGPNEQHIFKTYGEKELPEYLTQEDITNYQSMFPELAKKWRSEQGFAEGGLVDNSIRRIIEGHGGLIGMGYAQGGMVEDSQVRSIIEEFGGRYA